MKEKIVQQWLELFQSMPEKKEIPSDKEGEISVMKVEGEIDPEKMKDKMK